MIHLRWYASAALWVVCSFLFGCASILLFFGDLGAAALELSDRIKEAMEA